MSRLTEGWTLGRPGKLEADEKPSLIREDLKLSAEQQCLSGIAPQRTDWRTEVADKGESWSSAKFCEELKSRLKSKIGDRALRCKPSGFGSHEMAIINFYNVPESKARGATGENNRVMFTVDGFGKGEGEPSPRGKVKLETSVWSFSMSPWNMKRPRGKTAAPAKVLDTIVKVIEGVLKLEPKGLSERKLNEAEVDAAHAKAHAVTSPEELSKLFDRLKSKQTVWMAYSAVMSTASKDYRKYTIGRRSHSKKYNRSAITMLPFGQKKVGRFSKITLSRRGEGTVGVALGDMAASLIGLYVEK